MPGSARTSERIRPSSRMSGAAASCILLVASVAHAENRVFPVVGTVNVKAAPYLAAGDGTTDDTAAIQSALNAFPNGNRIIYLPDGVYRVTDRLTWPNGTGGNEFKRTILQGQSRDGTIIRLDDGAPGFGDPLSRRAVIWTGNAPAQRFRNGVRNLTVDVGADNPGASAIRFNSSNQGTVDTVRLVAAPGSGEVGLDMAYTSEIGPLYVRDIEIVGFRHGVRTGDAINSITMEHVRVEGQREAGILNVGQVLSIRGLRSRNSVPALINGSLSTGIHPGGAVTLLDAQLVHTGIEPSVAAVVNRGFLYARDIQAIGYATTVQNFRGPGLSSASETVAEWASQDANTLFGDPATALQLPAADPPEIPWDEDFSNWADVASFGAVSGASVDATAAFQAAIDSGASTIWLRGGTNYRIDGTVRVRGNVRRIIGGEGRLAGNGTIRFESGTAPAVILERMYAVSGSNLLLEHATSRTIVVANYIGPRIRSIGTGDFFLNDISCSKFDFESPGQRIWARQLNPESNNHPNIVNSGAYFWLLGLKTERGNTKILTQNGGSTELLGAHIYSTSVAKVDPLFAVTGGARFSATCVAESNFNGNVYGTFVSETRDSETRTLPRSALVSRLTANGVVMTLYAAAPDEESPLPRAYLEWAKWAVPPAADPAETPDAPLDDPNGEGIPNWLRFAAGAGANPGATPRLPVFTQSDDATALSFSFPPTRAIASVRPQWSDDLVTWNESGWSERELDLAEGIWYFSLPQQDLPKLFFRLKATPPSQP